MTPLPPGRGPSSPPPRTESSLVQRVVDKHRAGRPEALVTVCSTPAGVASYLVEAEVLRVRHEHGAVVVEWFDDRFGTVVSVLAGGAVVEVCCSDTTEQRDTYRRVCAEVDAENRETALEQIRGMVGAVMSELGLEAVDTETADEDGGENRPS